MTRRVVVIGGGLVGLGTAYALLRRNPGTRVTVLEKESAPGQHQSTHNSGVLHAGLYYAPGSFRAKLAVKGIRQMGAFCREHDVAIDVCGKVVVAVTDDEVPRLKALFERGLANGLTGLRMLSMAETKEIEPHVRCVAAVHVPEEGIADYAGVVRALALEIETRDGGEIVVNAPVTNIAKRDGGWMITAGNREHAADFIISCAGLHSDRIAEMAGETLEHRIVPFRGEYYHLAGKSSGLVRNLIYPVPDTRFPFLGVHLTRLIGGGIEAGPNAVLGLAREAYRKGTFSLRDTTDALSFIGLWRFINKYKAMVASEVRRSYSKARFAAALQRLVPEIDANDLAPGGAGVRAQALKRDGSIEQDFVFAERANALHVLNAPSPAATASLAIGEYIAERAAGVWM
jgi:L-2-hydroxyglutarate oxidase